MNNLNRIFALRLLSRNLINLTNTVISHPCKRSFITSCSRMLPIYVPSPYEPKDLQMRIRQKLGLIRLPKYKIEISSAWLYEACTDKVPIQLFVSEFELEDTYYSWFLVTELHVWMMCVRAMREGPEGKALRDALITRMWEDCESRMKKVARMPLKERKKALLHMFQQFQMAMMGYDEGLLSGDKELAAALWRLLYSFECDDPRHLETLVQYTRTQIDHLMAVDKDVMVLHGEEFEWAIFEPFHVA